MFKLIKVLITLAGLVALTYFVFMVPLGEKTFYEHLTRIYKTPEAQDLGSELKKKVETAGLRIKGQIDGSSDEPLKTPAAGEPSDTLDKAGLSELVEAPKSEVAEEDRRALKKLLERLDKE